MKKTKIISFLLSLTMLASTAIPSSLSLPAWADDGDEQDNVPFLTAEDGEDTPDPKKGMEISKTATPNEDGTYTITLEAYATGEKISSSVEKDVPTDIILVLDQSGSMDENMNTYDFRVYNNKSNSDYYNLRHNGAGNPNLYYKLEDGSYATVSVVRDQTGSDSSYKQCPSTWTNGGGWGNNNNYSSNKDNLYVKVGEKYQNVTLVRTGNWREYTYTYTFPDGSTVVSSGWNTSPGNFNGKGPLYVQSTTQEYSYTYSYTDKDGTSHQIGTSDGADTNPTDFTLYERYSTGSVTRLQALKTAVTNFSNSVAEKAKGKDGVLGTEDDVDHRIAVVGFAYGSKGYGDDPAYTNTELFIGSNQYMYGTSAQGQYDNAFQNMKTEQGQANVTASIGALTASGATYVDCGMEIANGILDANPVPAGEKRNRIVIVFTDGAPGWSGYESDVANSAITQANTARANGANVYSVGIFDGADATSAGNQNGNDTQKSNWFMQNLSDNKGTPQNPSYYLSASDADTLNNIFEQISDNIQEGGSSTTLDENAIIKDIISEQFTLPEGASKNDIKLYTAESNGSTTSWKEREEFSGNVTIGADNSVSVSGFSFKDNWCGTDTTNGTSTFHDGRKLIIEFNVVAKDGFLGGNKVPTNNNAGVYEDSTKEEPILIFPVPDVDVEIKPITVTAEDKNVYLMGDLTAEQIKEGATAKVGDVELNLGEDNYGLEPWQNEYVDITVTYQDKDGNTVTDLNDLTDDTTYTVSVKVSPKTNGGASEKTGNGEGKINVFKPELTYKDSNVYYGDVFPTDEKLAENLVSTRWVHESTEADAEKMGTAPELVFQYKPESGVDTNNKVNTKEDISVDVDVRFGTETTDITLNDYITFVHQACVPACDWTIPETNNGNPAFLLHVKTCTLIVQKIGGNSSEPYVFDVMKDGKKYTEVTVMGNSKETIVELPVGNYTIQEKTDWSWRYNASYGDSANLTAQNPTGTVTCTNTLANNYWLNGYSPVVKNIFGVKH